jgi:hypothetical protein
MEKNFIGAVVGCDEAEALVLDHFFDRAEHSVLHGATPLELSLGEPRRM